MMRRRSTWIAVAFLVIAALKFLFGSGVLVR